MLLGPIKVRLEQVWIVGRDSAEAVSLEVCAFDGCDVGNGECSEVEAAAVDLLELSFLETLVLEVRHEIIVVGTSWRWCGYVALKVDVVVRSEFPAILHPRMRSKVSIFFKIPLEQFVGNSDF